MNFDNLYYLQYSNYRLYFYCYILNVSADSSFGFLQEAYIQLRTESFI